MDKKQCPSDFSKVECLGTLSLQFVNCKSPPHRAICERASATCLLVMLWLPAVVSRGFWSWSLTTARPSRRWVCLSLMNCELTTSTWLSTICLSQAIVNNGLRGDQQQSLLMRLPRSKIEVIHLSNSAPLTWFYRHNAGLTLKQSSNDCRS